MRGSELPATSLISGALKACRGAFAAVGVFTAAINLLGLTGSLFMLQVYDRVLPSRSIPTLVALIGLVIALFAIQGALEAIRLRLLVRIGRSLDEKFSAQAYRALAQAPLRTSAPQDGLQSVRDLDQIRGFLSGVGPTALFDFPWMPFYIGICFAFHFWIGTTALIGALVLVALTVLTEVFSRKPAKDSSFSNAQRLVFAEATKRNAEAIQAMGMLRQLSSVWNGLNTKHMDQQQRASDVVGSFGSASRILRMLLQSIVLAVGAYLVMEQQASAGIIIASSILVARALAPVEIAIAHWKHFVSARQSWKRLTQLLATFDETGERTVLPTPTQSLSVEAVTIAAPGQQRLIVQNVTFRVEAGQAVGVIGPSASGKSCLARAIAAVWQPVRGKIRYDNAGLDQWPPDELGRHVGYLPQDVELFDGSIAQNIGRFEQPTNSEAVIEAARAAGAHDLILRLPEGYETSVGDFGAALSAGQRQRIALARALYKNPFVVVLDEPNSNLDAEGDEALTQAIMSIRKRGGIAIVVAHRFSALSGVDQILTLVHGRVQAFGPKDEVMSKVLEPGRLPMPRPVAATARGVG